MNENLDVIKYFDENLKKSHEKCVLDFIDFNIKTNGVDEALNKQTADLVYKLETKLQKENSSYKTSSNLKISSIVFIVIFCLGLIGSIIYLALAKQYIEVFVPIIVVCAIAIGLLSWSIVSLKHKITTLDKQISDTSKMLEKNRQICLKEVAKFIDALPYQLDDKLIEKNYGEINFDSFFNYQHEKIWANWIEKYLNKTTMLTDVKTGKIATTPFILANTKQQKWKDQIYTGSKVCFYTVSNGKGGFTTASVVITATVTNPAVYYDDTTSFSFLSQLTNKSNIHNESKLEKEKKVDKFYKKQGGKNMRPMENIKFDQLFPCIRDDEVEFRSIFTPYAQEKIVELLANNDYFYTKNKEYSRVIDKNNYHFDLSSKDLIHFDLAILKDRFFKHQLSLFKNIYNLASLFLSIPLYQRQTYFYDDIKNDENYISKNEIESFVTKFVLFEYFNLLNAKTAFIHKVIDLKNEYDKTNKLNWSTFKIENNSFDTKKRIVNVPVFDIRVGTAIIPVEVIDYLPIKSSDNYLYFYEKDKEIDAKQDFSSWLSKQQMIIESKNDHSLIKHKWSFGPHNFMLLNTSIDKISPIEISQMISDLKNKYQKIK